MSSDPDQNELKRRYEKLSSIELLEIVQFDTHNYRPEAINAALEVLASRGVANQPDAIESYLAQIQEQRIVEQEHIEKGDPYRSHIVYAMGLIVGGLGLLAASVNSMLDTESDLWGAAESILPGCFLLAVGALWVLVIKKGQKPAPHSPSLPKEMNE